MGPTYWEQILTRTYSMEEVCMCVIRVYIYMSTHCQDTALGVLQNNTEVSTIILKYCLSLC